MATTPTALRKMRELCLSLPNTVETEHFGEAYFRVGKRGFASCGEKDGVCRLVFQLEPAHARRLLASDSRFAPYARQKNCVWIDAGYVKDWDEVRSLVLESYRLNEPSSRPPRKARKTVRKKAARK